MLPIPACFPRGGTTSCLRQARHRRQGLSKGVLREIETPQTLQENRLFRNYPTSRLSRTFWILAYAAPMANPFGVTPLGQLNATDCPEVQTSAGLEKPPSYNRIS